MVRQALRNKSVFDIWDERKQRTAFGFNQNWYTSTWQRMAGCGPTAVANIIYYLQCRRTGVRTDSLDNKTYRMILMEELWKHVTPSLHGINSAKMLYEGVLSYASAKGMEIDIGMVDIPKRTKLRPAYENVQCFIEMALMQDTPVAFLNLHHGEETQLDSWHWVTIISLEVPEGESSALVEILDEGKLKRIDFRNWYRTTTLGGGLVRFEFKE